MFVFKKILLQYIRETWYMLLDTVNYRICLILLGKCVSLICLNAPHILFISHIQERGGRKKCIFYPCHQISFLTILMLETAWWSLLLLASRHFFLSIQNNWSRFIYSFFFFLRIHIFILASMDDILIHLLMQERDSLY